MTTTTDTYVMNLSVNNDDTTSRDTKLIVDNTIKNITFVPHPEFIDFGQSDGITSYMTPTGKYQAFLFQSFGTSGVYLSDNYGVSFRSISELSRVNNQAWKSIGISDDGQYMTVTGYQIWSSTNAGLNWFSRSTTGRYRSIGMSGNGEIQVTVYGKEQVFDEGGSIWKSTNSGVDWIQNADPILDKQNWTDIDVSYDATFQTATVDVGNVWKSDDKGVNWTEHTTSFGGPKAWRKIKISRSGQYRIACATEVGNIWISEDYGNSWVNKADTINSSYEFTNVAINSSGSIMMLTAVKLLEIGSSSFPFALYHYTSTDFGNTWSRSSGDFEYNDPRRIGLSLSDTADYVLMPTQYGRIYTSSKSTLDTMIAINSSSANPIYSENVLGLIGFYPYFGQYIDSTSNTSTQSDYVVSSSPSGTGDVWTHIFGMPSGIVAIPTTSKQNINMITLCHVCLTSRVLADGNLCSVANTIGYKLDTNVIDMICIAGVPYGQYINHIPGDPTDNIIRYRHKKTLSKIDVELTDIMGRPLRLPTNYHMLVLLRMYYDLD